MVNLKDLFASRIDAGLENGKTQFEASINMGYEEPEIQLRAIHALHHTLGLMSTLAAESIEIMTGEFNGDVWQCADNLEALFGDMIEIATSVAYLMQASASMKMAADDLTDPA